MAGGVSLARVLQLTGVYPLMRSLQSIISLDTSERSFGVETLDRGLGLVSGSDPKVLDPSMRMLSLREGECILAGALI